MIGKPEWISTIMLYGTEGGWEALEKKDLSLDERRALAAGLANAVRKIHAPWFEQREKQVAEGKSPAIVRRAPLRNPGTVGPDDPCPFGSGKKHRQCHGSSRLH